MCSSFWGCLWYGSGQQRYYQCDESGRWTFYVDKLYEQKSSTLHKLYLGDYGVFTVDVTSGQNSGITYLHKDRLGSIVAMTDETGNPVQNADRGYDPFGKPREGNWGDSNGLDGAGDFGDLNRPDQTTRGFTGHEHLNNVAITHMNGRAYDYNLGRFLSVDPVIQFPANSQSLNPYSYIMNNPLSGTDPTGYSLVGLPAGSGSICGENVFVICFMGGFSLMFESKENGNDQKITIRITAKGEIVQLNDLSKREVESVTISGTEDDITVDIVLAGTSSTFEKISSFLAPELTSFINGDNASGTFVDRLRGFGKGVANAAIAIDTLNPLPGGGFQHFIMTGQPRFSPFEITPEERGGAAVFELATLITPFARLESVPAQIIKNAAAGEAFQAAGESALGLTRNNRILLNGTTRSGMFGRTRPDSIVFGAGGRITSIFEFKNVNILSFTRQLQLQISAATELRVPLNLIVSPRTRLIRESLKNEIKKAGGSIKIFDPKTGKLTPYGG